MILRRSQIAVLLATCSLFSSGLQKAHAEREWLSWEGAKGLENYGQPVELKGKHIYFTSWKYVRAGQVRWVNDQKKLTSGQILDGGGLQGDGGQIADFVPDAMTRGIRLVAQEAQKIDLSSTPRPGNCIIYDEGKYKTWGFASDKDGAYVSYGTSEDGTNWQRPQLGLFESGGNRSNSIVYRCVPGRGCNGGNVFVDPSSKTERYKMIYVGSITKKEWEAFTKKYPGEADSMVLRLDIPPCAVFGVVSPDGVHWTDRPEPLFIQHADTENICYYDVDLKKYVAYVRTWQANRVSPKSPGWTDTWMNVGRRSIGRAMSDDFRHFSKAETVFSTGADMPSSHVWYSNGKTTLPDAPDNHVMFPWLWETEVDGGDVHLLSSADGLVWSKVPGGPVIRRGPVGSADGSSIFANLNLLEYPGDIWGLPFSGTPVPHKYPGRSMDLRTGLFPGVKGISGLAVWPKGRLVALQADGDGEFCTLELIPPTKKIRLNACVEPSGYISVSLGLEQSQASDRIVGDGLAMPVTWNGDPEIKSSGPITLKFKMRQAKLFAIEFY